MLRHRLLFVWLIGTLMFSSTSVSLAGTAPPTNSPGGSIAPDPTSQDAQASAAEITLSSQTIELVVRAAPDATELTPNDLGGNASDSVQASVTGKYVLRNNFSSDIRQGLSFPLSDLSGLKDAQGNVPEVQDFAVNVGDAPVSYSVVTRTNPYGDSEPPIKWATFSATIPARDEVTISTTATSPASGQMPVAKFNFSLDTANAWAGRVGASEIVVRLPYPANRENVFLSESTPGGRFDGDSVRWVRRRFEPRSNDNFVVSLLAPQIWQAILDARAAAAANPTDAEAQVALARAYKAAIALENGVPQGSSRQFVAQAERAYQKAIELDPGNANVRVDYAQTLSDLHLAEDLTSPRRAVARLTQIVEILQGALRIDPNNAAAIKLLAQMKKLAADLTTRSPSRATNALNAAVAEAEQLMATAPSAGQAQATPTGAPSAEATPVPEAGAIVTPTMSAPQATAIVEAQATVTAAGALTTTPDAPQATAIAQAQVTLEAHATTMAAPTAPLAAQPTATAAAAVVPAATRDVGTGLTNASNAGTTTVVARTGLLAAVSIACGVIFLLGILAAVLVALFGRKQTAAVVKSDSTTTTSNSADDSTKGG